MTRFASLVATILVLALPAGCGGSDSDSDASQGRSTGAAEILSVDALRQAAAEGTPPIYWAGEQGEAELELSRPEEGRTYVRYLTGDAEAGDERADFLTVGTYAQPNAVAFLRRQAKRSGGTIGHAPGGATVYFDRDDPGSVYLAYPGSPVQIEVYDPSFERALRLVNAGEIAAVD